MSGGRSYPDRIDFQTRTVARTDSGRPTETWSTVFSRRAKVIGGKSSEGVKDNQHQNGKNYTVKLPTDTAAAALDPQATRIIWKRTAGNIPLNVIGKDEEHGRRPELVFETVTDS
jgi:hypothetical protein